MSQGGILRLCQYSSALAYSTDSCMNQPPLWCLPRCDSLFTLFLLLLCIGILPSGGAFYFPRLTDSCIYILLGPSASMSFWYIPSIHWLCPYFLGGKTCSRLNFSCFIWVHKLYIVVVVFSIHFILFLSQSWKLQLLKETQVCFE